MRLTAILCTFALIATAAHGGVATTLRDCRSVDGWHRHLSGEKFAERPMIVANAGNPKNPVPVELWSNPHTGTWTLLALPKPGVACQLASGFNLQPATRMMAAPDI